MRSRYFARIAGTRFVFPGPSSAYYFLVGFQKPEALIPLVLPPRLPCIISSEHKSCANHHRPQPASIPLFPPPIVDLLLAFPRQLVCLPRNRLAW